MSMIYILRERKTVQDKNGKCGVHTTNRPKNVSLRAKLLNMYVSKSNMMAMAILIMSAKQKHISMLPSMHTDGICAV